MGTVSTATRSWKVSVPCRGVCTDGSARYLDMRWAVDTPIARFLSLPVALLTPNSSPVAGDRAFLLPFAHLAHGVTLRTPASFRLLPL